MREAVYLILTLAIPGPALGFDGTPKRDVGTAGHHSVATRFDLRAPTVLSWSGPASARTVLAAPYDALKWTADHSAPPPASPARGALAWALPSGLSFLAAGSFGQATLIGQPTWPLGATVPVMMTSAAIAFDLEGVAGSPLRLNLSVNRNWQLDGPIGGAFLDCAVRLDVAAEAAPKISFQAPCGAAGHFAIGLRGSF